MKEVFKHVKLKPISEHSYSWEDGFTFSSYMQSHKGGMRQIDWEKVKYLLESPEYDYIEVGLAEDYSLTHAVIYKDGKIVIEENDECGFYGASRWATPAIKLYKNGESELFECWIYGEQTGFPKWLYEMAKEKGWKHG